MKKRKASLEMYDLSHGTPRWGEFRFLGTIVLNVVLYFISYLILYN